MRRNPQGRNEPRAEAGPSVGFEEWITLLGSFKGRYSMKGVESGTFVGTVQSQSVCGLEAVDIACSVPAADSANLAKVDRTHRDIRIDDRENFYAVFQVSGRSLVEQHNQTVDLGAGDIALIDSSLPVTYAMESQSGHWLSLILPRQTLVSTLGSEPLRHACRHTTNSLAQRLLFQLAVEALSNPDQHSTAEEPYLRLAVYDLVGALFVASDLPVITPHSDKTFRRVCDIIQESFTDPDLTPSRVAEDAGISLRYLQKLFTARGTTFCHWLYGLRLDHAARLLRHRASLKTGQPLSMIAYASGFRDYSHFARAFRRRFGHHPGRR